AAIGEARQQALRLEGGVGDELGAQVPVERGRGHAGRGQSTPRCTPPVVAGGASRKQAHSELLLTRGGLVPPRRAGGAGRARRCVEITPRGAATFSAGAIRKVLGQDALRTRRAVVAVAARRSLGKVAAVEALELGVVAVVIATLGGVRAILRERMAGREAQRHVVVVLRAEIAAAASRVGLAAGAQPDALSAARHGAASPAHHAGPAAVGA